MAKKQKPDMLVCARLDRPEHHVRGSVRGHHCARCHTEVVVARSGQRVLREWPAIEIACLACAKVEMDKDDTTVEGAPGALEEFLEDLAQDAVEVRAKHRRN